MLERMWIAIACAALSGAIGCTSEPRVEDEDAGADAGPDAGSDAGPDGGDDDGCSENAKLVYVVDHDSTLYRFDPPDEQFYPVGVIDCPSGGSPFSMAVSREGIAYVLFTNFYTNCIGINAIDIDDATCLGLTGFVCDESGYNRFGMGFATDGPDTEDETLFIGKADTTGSDLASVDLDDWSVWPIGPIYGAPELTGNALGELWAFFAWAEPPKVAQLDKENGIDSNSVVLPELAGSSAFAFAFWGGDFYLFHAPAGDTTVYRLSDGVLETYMSDTGVEIVGAGVSTCAPVDIE